MTRKKGEEKLLQLKLINMCMIVLQKDMVTNCNSFKLFSASEKAICLQYLTFSFMFFFPPFSYGMSLYSVPMRCISIVDWYC